ncbi:MAG: iron-sulfur cluster carrier protein ApbC [Azoarcus sp.]|jgi:ATP-binding protein involved in chromosome partitioning|nr:iron-sulfur cluster carrier protein ApbC [Azoarcus sp.]
MAPSLAAPSEQSINDALQSVTDFNTGKDFVSTRRLRGLTIKGGTVRFEVEPGYPVRSQRESIRNLLADAVRSLPGVEKVEIEISGKIEARAVKNGVKLLPSVKNVIAVASGKGGVGKSTTAVNLALALAAEGANVGMLDADIYGPSLPQMLGIGARRPESTDGETMEPVEAHGLQVMSVGLLVDDDTPMVWRGPMATRALTQLMTETRWRNLDYLVVDLPPGTGDIQLTLAQSAPLTGAVIVTTPQDIALIDARKGLKMFEKVNVPILGVVENMGIHICSGCGREEHIFGAGGGQKICDDYGVPFLGALPLDLKIREEADSGAPTVASDPESRIAEIYREIARKTAVALAGIPRDMSHKFPNIVVKNG